MDELTAVLGGCPTPRLEDTPPPSSLPPAVGRFRVEREIGRGGMGVVLLARDRDLNRPVAVKLLREDHPETLARFRLEAHALAGLTHPNAVRVYESGEHAGRPYLALEYVAGHTLDDALRDGPLAPTRAAALLGAVAGAVQAAHDLGVVHRDLKPANVLLDAADTPKLTDFGIARRLDGSDGLTATNMSVGTPGYMAPEQAAGLAPDARTDVYGLGATLYECLTGRPPFVGPTAAVLHQVMTAEPVSPRRLNAGVPRDLETVCLKCLEKDPARRYPSAAELAADLKRVERGESVKARPTGRAVRALRWGRRNRATAALAAAVVLSLVGGAGAAGWQAVRATAARDAEAGQRQLAQDQAAAAEAARAEATAAQARAEQKAAEAEAFNQFVLHDLIHQASSTAQANAKYKPDPNLTVREAVKRAADRVDERFRTRPAVATEVRVALGNAFRGLGEFAAAADQHQLAWESNRDRLGPDHPHALFALNHYAQSLHAGGNRQAEARPLFEDCLARRRAVLGPDHPDTLETQHNLACLLHKLGRMGEAIPLHDDAHRRRAAVEPTHPNTLTMLEGRAMTYESAGRLAEAAGLFDELVEGRRAVLGPTHPSTLTAVGNRGHLLSRLGRHPEAVAAFEESLRGHTAALGPDHPETAVVRSGLALVYNRAGRPADALPLNESALKQLRATHGPTHPQVLTALNNLALDYHAVGRTADAVDRLEECLPLRRQVSGPTHPDTLLLLNNLGMLSLFAGRHADGFRYLEECLRGQRVVLGPDHHETIGIRLNLASGYQAAGRVADALPLFEANWKAKSAAVPPHPDVNKARVVYAGALVRAGRYAEAETHLRAAEAAMAAGPGRPNRLLWVARFWLGELCDRTARFAEAADWWERMAEAGRAARAG